MRTRSLAIASVLVAFGALAVVMFFANRDDSARNDALLFLDRYEGIDVDDPAEERRARVDMISGLPIGSEEVDHVRDLCVDAHRTLLRAEDRGAEARVAFDQAMGGRRRAEVDEDEIPTDVRATIEAALAESNGALEIARDAMPRCLSAVRGLEVRFQPQRARR